MVCQDLPDYTRKMIIEYSGGFIGLEELATRLGFIAPFNLQGNLVMMEDFETEETEWAFTANTANDLVERVSTTKWSGNWSIHIHTDGIATAEAWAHRDFYYPGLLKYGFFCRAKWDTNLCVMQIDISFQSPTHFYSIFINYNLLLPRLTVVDIGGAGVVCSTTLTAIWFPIYLTFDLSTMRGDKLFFAGFEFDISTLGLTAVAVPASPYTRIRFGTEHVAGGVAHDTWWDDIVLTKNVP